MKKQYVDVNQLEALNLNEQVLFIIDANISNEYCYEKSVDVKQSDLDSWRKERKQKYRNNLAYMLELTRKLNAIKLMQLITDFTNHIFFDFSYLHDKDMWTIKLFHDVECDIHYAEGKELIDVLLELLNQMKSYISLDYMGRVK